MGCGLDGLAIRQEPSAAFHGPNDDSVTIVYDNSCWAKKKSEKVACYFNLIFEM